MSEVSPPNDAASRELRAESAPRPAGLMALRVGRTLAFAGVVVHAGFCPISIAATQIGLAIAAAGIATAIAAGFRPSRTPLDAPLAALVVVCIASDLLSPYGPPSLAFATLWRSALGFWIVLQSLSLVAERRLRNAALAFAAAGLCVSAIVGLVQFRTGIDLVHLLGLRQQARAVEAPGLPGRFGAMGFFISRLTFGHNATLLVALLGGSLAAGALRGRTAALAGCAVVLGIAGIAATFDRAAWLGIGAAALVVALFSGRGRRVALACALLLVPAVLFPGVRSRVSTTFDWRANADRLFLWARAREIVRDHPWHGIGFGNYPRVCGIYYDRVDPTVYMRTWAHNSELSLLAETGPLGLLALLWAGFRAVRALVLSLRAGEPIALGALAAVTALAVIGQAHDVFYDTKVMYALWLGIALGLPSRGRFRPAV
ncbi:MAG: O-antigen ligase family protein [Myxococcales bacterium]